MNSYLARSAPGYPTCYIEKYGDLLEKRLTLTGVGAKIRKNIRVGNHVVIGANVVDVKDLPDDVFAGGVPAVVIGKLN